MWDDSNEWQRSIPHFFKRYLNFLRGAGRIAIGVISIGGKSKADGSFVTLFGALIELVKPGHLADEEREDAGGHGIEGAKMSDGAFAEDFAHAGHDIVRGPSSGFVDDHHTVEWHASGIVYGEAVRGQIEGASLLPKMMERCLQES